MIYVKYHDVDASPLQDRADSTFLNMHVTAIPLNILFLRGTIISNSMGVFLNGICFSIKLMTLSHCIHIRIGRSL